MSETMLLSYQMCLHSLPSVHLVKIYKAMYSSLTSSPDSKGLTALQSCFPKFTHTMLYLITNDQSKNFSTHPHTSRQLIMPRHWGLRHWGNYLTDNANYDYGRGNKVSSLLGLRLFCNSNHHALTLQRCQKLKERLTDKPPIVHKINFSIKISYLVVALT